LTDTIMSDLLPGTAEAFPDKLQIFRRDRKMTIGDHVNHDPNDWQAYTRADAVQAQIDAAWKARARDLAARGDEVQMKELNVARDKAKKERA
jgi:hypothetical protein